MAEPTNSDEGGFLGRWSRRKLKHDIDVAAVQATPPVAMSAEPAEPDTRPRDPETGEVIDEELVSRLPKVSDLQAGGDLSSFMQKGVPEALRREALRTMWLNDPMIRNYVSPALDYAYDYNVPGGAPGYGPLTESDLAQARDFLANVFSTPQTVPAVPETDQKTGNRDNESHNIPAGGLEHVRISDAALQNEDEADAGADLKDLNIQALGVTISPQDTPDAIVQRNKVDAGEPLPALPRRRRGGGAAPV